MQAPGIWNPLNGIQNPSYLGSYKYDEAFSRETRKCWRGAPIRGSTMLDFRYNEEPRDWQNVAKCVRSNEISLYRGSFPYILLLLG